MRYYRLSDTAVIDLDPVLFDALASEKRAAHRPYVEDPKPTVTASQKIVSGPVVITELAATKTWTVAPKTQAEIDDEAEALQRATDYAQAKAVYLDLRNGVGTAGERLARLEKVVARLLRDVLLSRVV